MDERDRVSQAEMMPIDEQIAAAASLEELADILEAANPPITDSGDNGYPLGFWREMSSTLLSVLETDEIGPRSPLFSGITNNHRIRDKFIELAGIERQRFVNATTPNPRHEARVLRVNPDQLAQMREAADRKANRGIKGIVNRIKGGH